jgi:hypothetical protein
LSTWRKALPPHPRCNPSHSRQEKKEEPTPNRLPIDASKLYNEEMDLVIKSFWQIMKQRKGKDYKPRSKGFATGVVSPVILLLNVHIQVIVTGTTIRK